MNPSDGQLQPFTRTAGISEPYALRAVDKFLPGAPTKHEVIVRGKYGFCLIPKGARVNVEGRAVPFKANCTIEFLDGLTAGKSTGKSNGKSSKSSANPDQN